MSLKIAAEITPNPRPSEAAEVVIREYNKGKDKAAVEELESRCEVGQTGKPSLVTDLMGDPMCRIRNFSSHVMLVAEYGKEGEISGVIRGCLKTVTTGKDKSGGCPVYVKLVYILGLRVSPTRRRLGIGVKLVQHLEEWCHQNGAEFAYMATDCSNRPSINLFTKKCKYVKFRTPSILVHPVHAHYKPLGSGIAIIQVPPQLAISIYHRIFSNSEFFPKDIGTILMNKLNLGTYMALPKKSLYNWRIGILPTSYAILSIWNTKEVFKLQVKGASTLTYALCSGSRTLDNLMPWLRLPSINPNLFSQFGVYFLYGIHMEGRGASRLMMSLWSFAHNMAKEDGECEALVAEVGHKDPVRKAIPHWKKLSWDEDMWCIKKLATAKQQPSDDERCAPRDWITSPSSSPVIFVDPRDF